MVCECGAEIREGSRFCGKCGRPVPVAAAAEIANQAAAVAETVESAVTEDAQTVQEFAEEAVQTVAQDSQAFVDQGAQAVQQVVDQGVQAAQPYMPYGNQPTQPYANQPVQHYPNQPAQPYPGQAPMTNPDGTPIVPPPYPWEKAAKVKKEKAPKAPKEPKEPKEKKPLNKRLIQYVAMGLGLILLVLGIIGLITKTGGGTGSESINVVQQTAVNPLPNGGAKNTANKFLQLFDKVTGETVEAVGTVTGGMPGDVGKIAQNLTDAGETVTGGGSGGSFLNKTAWPFTIAGGVLLLGGAAWFFLDSKKNKKAAEAAA